MKKSFFKYLVVALAVVNMLSTITACTQYTQIRYVSEEAPATPMPLIVPPEANDIKQLPEIENTPAPIPNSSSIVLSEISSAGQDWVEFYNPSNTAVMLSDFYIGSSPDFFKAAQLPGISVGPEEYCCVYGKNENEPIKADFSINKSGDSLVLFRSDGTIIDTVSVPELNRYTSLVHNNEEWEYTYFKTPGKINSHITLPSLQAEEYSSDSPLIISEVLASNKHSVLDCYSEYNDYAEIFNPSSMPVSLNGWFLSDTQTSVAKWAFPDITIDPGQYMTVFLSGHESKDHEMHASFCLNPDETLVLFNSNDNKYLWFDLPAALLPDISVGPEKVYYRFPTPGFKNSEVISDITNIGYYFADDIYISEVCGNGDDWVELYNGSDRAIDIFDWKLTDNALKTDKYIFPHTVLEPGDYCVVKASSHPTEQKNETARFGISLSGETLFLFDNSGRVRDAFKTGTLTNAASCGRIENRTDIERVFFAAATPGRKNSGSYSTGRTSEPVFSVTALYCEEPFSLELSAEKGAEIYFTSDGSEPTASSKLLYTKPIRITKNTVIRAIAIKDGCINSNTVSYTYLFEDKHSVPVVCISLSPSDKDAVWSAKSKQSKTKVEREGHLAFYEADGKIGTSFAAGFKPKGAGTLGRSQASLSIHLRGMYGQSSVTYPFFAEYGWEKYASLVVRNSGQDYQKARIRDSLSSRICLGLNIDVSATRPVAVYVNGKYYGLYDLNEDQNADFLNTHYGIDQKNVEIIRFNTVAVKGSNANWKKIIDFAKTKNFKSDDVYDDFIKQIDDEYFMDYLICSIYLCNSDMANQKYWHTVDNKIKWRPIFYDFDYAIGFNRSAKSSIMERFFDPDGTATATSRIYTHIACALVQNPGWRQRFIERYIELTYTTFDPDRVSKILDRLVSEMEVEMPRHISKWGPRNAPASMKEWRQNIEDIRSWFSQRQKYAVESLKKYFRLSDTEIETLKKRYIRP